jgi:hypothetical protein
MRARAHGRARCLAFCRETARSPVTSRSAQSSPGRIVPVSQNWPAIYVRTYVRTYVVPRAGVGIHGCKSRTRKPLVRRYARACLRNGAAVTCGKRDTIRHAPCGPESKGRVPPETCGTSERSSLPPYPPTPYPSLHPPHRKQKTIAPTDRFYRPRLRARNGTGRNGTERNGTERKGTNCRECAGGIFQALRIGASSATRSGILESFSSSGRSPRLYSGKLRHSRTFNHARRAFRSTRSRSLDRPQPCRSLIAINLWRGFPKHLDSTATRNAAL